MVIPFYKHLIQRVAFFGNMSICNINIYFRNTLTRLSDLAGRLSGFAVSSW